MYSLTSLKDVTILSYPTHLSKHLGVVEFDENIY